MFSDRIILVAGVGLLTSAVIFFATRYLERRGSRRSLTHVGWLLLAIVAVLVVLLNIGGGPLAIQSPTMRVALILICACAFGAGVVFAQGHSDVTRGEPS
jgi:drug/metabolite transporter (DMT)-like permease